MRTRVWTIYVSVWRPIQSASTCFVLFAFIDMLSLLFLHFIVNILFHLTIDSVSSFLTSLLFYIVFRFSWIDFCSFAFPNAEGLICTHFIPFNTFGSPLSLPPFFLFVCVGVWVKSGCFYCKRIRGRVSHYDRIRAWP